MFPVTRRFFGMIAFTAVGCLLSGALVRGDDTPAPAPAPTGTATITGTVTSNGSPVSGANVVLLPPKKTDSPTTQPTPNDAPQDGQGGAGGGAGGAAHHRPKPIAKTTTAADGTFSFTNVAAGNYIVSAMLKGTGAGKATVTVADGGTATVNIALAQRTHKPAPAAQ